MSNAVEEIKDYYHTKESRWGYQLVLGGVKHFGYYPGENKKISMQRAMQNMMDKVGSTLDLPKDSLVLDAGCGEGATAEYIAKNFNLRVEGIDLLDFNIDKAKRRTAAMNGKLNFQVGDYAKLNFPDNHFDAVYTLETLVHSPDYVKALKEFRRVLKNNGKLVLFEYSMSEDSSMTAREKWAFDTVSKGSAMHSFPKFRHGMFPQLLSKAGFKNCQVEDITKYMVPMLRRFWMLGIVPYRFIAFFGKEKKFVNTTSGVELYKYRDKFRYNIVTATKG